MARRVRGPGPVPAGRARLSGRTLLTDLLFDGERVVRGPTLVELDGPAIAAVRPLPPDAPPPPGALDLRGELVLPGLINAHVHIARAGAFGPREPLSIGQVVTNLEATLAAGVTTVGEMGCPPAMARALAEHSRRCPGEAPEVRAAGPLVTAPHGYPLDWVPPFVLRMGVVEAVSDAASARRAVDRVVAAGMHHVKLAIMHESYAGRPMPALAPGPAREVVQAARAAGLRSMAHAHSVADWRVALDAGADAIVHSSFEPLDGETLRRARDQGVSMCPTLWVFEAVCGGPGRRLHADPRYASSVSPAIRRDWRAFSEAWEASADVVPPGIAGGLPKARAVEGVRVAAANLRLLREHGVPVGFGNDAAYGFCVHGRPADELSAMQRAGMPPLDVLRAATAGSADLLGATDRGRLAPGRRADLLVVPPAALEDVAQVEHVRRVIAAGRDVSPGFASRARARLAVLRGMAGCALDALRYRSD